MAANSMVYGSKAKQLDMGAIAFSNEHFNLAGGVAINFAFAARRLIKYTQTGNWAP